MREAPEPFDELLTGSGRTATDDEGEERPLSTSPAAGEPKETFACGGKTDAAAALLVPLANAPIPLTPSFATDGSTEASIEAYGARDTASLEGGEFHAVRPHGSLEVEFPLAGTGESGSDRAAAVPDRASVSATANEQAADTAATPTGEPLEDSSRSRSTRPPHADRRAPSDATDGRGPESVDSESKGNAAVKITSLEAPRSATVDAPRPSLFSTQHSSAPSPAVVAAGSPSPPLSPLPPAAGDRAVLIDRWMAPPDGSRPDAARILREAQESDVLRQVAIHVRPGATELRVRLDPPELGEVRIRFIAEAGRVRARVRATDGATAELLRNRAGELREALRGAGIPLTDLDVHEERRRTGRGTREDADAIKTISPRGANRPSNASPAIPASAERVDVLV